MLPRILEYDKDTNTVTVTAEAYGIPEINAILQKYKEPERYLSYVCSMSHPDSPYMNLPETERKDTVIYDIQQTYGDFDFEDPLLDKAINKKKSPYMSKMGRFSEELGGELDRFTALLREKPLTFENAPMRQDILKNADKYSAAYQKAKRQADEELGSGVKGDHEIGMY